MYQKNHWQDHWTNLQIPWKSSLSDKLFVDRSVDILEQHHLPSSSKIFIPLCGDSEAVLGCWHKGADVTALDFIPDPISKLAQEYTAVTGKTMSDSGAEYRGERLKLLVKDIFSTKFKSEFDIVYDRAALVALSEHDRVRYSAIVTDSLRPRGLMYLVTSEFDDSLIPRPPYAVTRAEIRKLYPMFEIIWQEEKKQETLPPRLAEAGVTELITITTLLQRKSQ